jgi:hypothetical protein
VSRRGHVLTAAIIAVVVNGGLGAAASADTTPSVVTTSPILIQGSGFDWTTQVVLQGTGACPAAGDFSLVINETTVVGGPKSAGTSDPGGCQLDESGTSFLLTFSLKGQTIPQTAYLTVDIGSSPNLLTLQVVRRVGLVSKLAIPVGGGGLLALSFVGWALRSGERRKGTIEASASWTFSDSWATNITAVGALLGTALTAAGAVSQFLPGLSLDWFTVLNVVWGGLVVLSPLIIGAVNTGAGNADRGVKIGRLVYLAASFVTLLGVGGELGTIASLVNLSNGDLFVRILMLVGLGSVALLVFFYSTNTTKSLFREKRQSTLSPGPSSSLTL